MSEWHKTIILENGEQALVQKFDDYNADTEQSKWCVQVVFNFDGVLNSAKFGYANETLADAAYYYINQEKVQGIYNEVKSFHE